MKKLVIAAFVLSSLAGTANADSLNEALIAGLNKSDALNAARQSYAAARESVIIAQAGNDLTGNVSITGSHTESDRKSASGGFQSS